MYKSATPMKLHKVKMPGSKKSKTYSPLSSSPFPSPFGERIGEGALFKRINPRNIHSRNQQMNIMRALVGDHTL